jgi:ABC-type methionine transport system ATPase subunit
VLRNVTFPLELTGVGIEERNKRLRELLSLVDLLDKKKHILQNFQADRSKE